MFKNFKKFKLKRAAAGILAMMLLLSMALLSGCGTEEAAQTEADQLTIVDASGETGFETLSETESETTAEESSQEAVTQGQDSEQEAGVTEDGTYTSKEEVALYIHTYGKLPSNYITKKEAENLGWSSSRGNLWDVAPGMSIGGSNFGNYEGLLPEKSGRRYYECDIDYNGGYRGAKRIIYSNDGLVFYTEDHYETFEQLY